MNWLRLETKFFRNKAPMIGIIDKTSLTQTQTEWTLTSS